MSVIPRALLPGRGQIFMTAAANPLSHPQLNPIVQEWRLSEMIYNVFLSNNESLLLKSGIKLLPGGRNRFSSYGVWRWEKKASMNVCMGYVTRYFLKGIQGHWGSSPAFPFRAVGLKLGSLDALINKEPQSKEVWAQGGGKPLFYGSDNVSLALYCSAPLSKTKSLQFTRPTDLREHSVDTFVTQLLTSLIKFHWYVLYLPWGELW